MPVVFLFLTNISHLKDVLLFTPYMLKNMHPVTNDMTVSFELERLGIKYIDEWDYLTPNDIENNKDAAHKLAQDWWDEAIQSTSYNGIVLTKAAQEDLIFSFEASLNARTVYSRLFEAYKVREIFGYFPDPVAVVRTGPTPASKAVQSVAYAVLFYLAEKQGIGVYKLN
jgi:hypothetical protein